MAETTTPNTTNGTAQQPTTATSSVASPLSLANTFNIAVESFGLVHGSPKWERNEQLELTRLGVQQGRLLAVGDAVGVCETGEGRDARLDDADTRETVDAALKAIIDRPQNTERTTQFEKFGLKPPKRSLITFEPAVDITRLEVFKEKLYFMRERERAALGPRGRGRNFGYTHWQIVDANKFASYVGLLRDSIDLLVELFGIADKVDMALRHDIRALGWHPVFEKSRASRDMSKLKMIKEVCETEYPTYAAAADTALTQLDIEWKDHYQALMERKPTSTEIPMAASRQIAAANKAAQNQDGERRGSLFDLFRPKHKRKHSKQESNISRTPAAGDDTAPRSKSLSHAAEETQDADPLKHARSKSISVFPVEGAQSPDSSFAGQSEDDIDPLSRVETSKSLAGLNLEPVSSMISRRDQAYLHMHRASIA